MSEEPVKRKRGRPRKDSAAPLRTTRQRSRQAPVPILNVATYGRRESLEDAPPPKKKEPVVKSSAPMNPIILSLPVSDELENRNTVAQTTLVDQFTEYRPDVKQNIPSGVIHSATLGSIFEGNSAKIEIQRCEKCVTTPNACQECIENFNHSHRQSLEEYEERRRNDEIRGKKPTRLPSFLRGESIEKPSELQVLKYDPNIVAGVGNNLGELDDEPQGLCSIEHGEQVQDDSQHQLAQLNDQVRILKLQLKSALSVAAAIPEKAKHEDIYRGAYECLWHLDFFETPPVCLPMHYDSVTQEFDGIGPFCSLECAYAYRLEHRSAEAAPIRLLHLAHSKRSDYDGTPLYPAPPRQALIRFGGSLNLETFLSKTRSWYDVFNSPFFFQPLQVEEIDTMYRSMSGVKCNAVAATTTSNELVRKREKPHPNAMNQWDAAIQRSRLRKK